MPSVLIAEDDEDIALILSRLLKRAGYTVTHAPDGQRAFEMAVADRPDVVLTDLGMPRMDGLELTRSIRAHPELRDTPIVMLSGHLHPGDSGPIAAGVCVVLLKPCPNDRLREVVTELTELGAHGHSGADSGCPAIWPVSV
ncbi:response regulator [Actinoplanes sp. TRM 88003]|uniref:Response regulator n=1 Tax=Paractinoplanes aksuensis TaxID=2939490 RepID=A0ABT1DM83_9ACTN|nr:response regulator [Actinoplanes aksuensis]MCO8271150.1 response regulator [Actinoplanes aksuensis]